MQPADNSSAFLLYQQELEYGVSMLEVQVYLHLDGNPAHMTDDELWEMVGDCYHSLATTMRTPRVPKRLLLQVIAIRYYQPRAHRRKEE